MEVNLLLERELFQRRWGCRGVGYFQIRVLLCNHRFVLLDGALQDCIVLLTFVELLLQDLDLLIVFIRRCCINSRIILAVDPRLHLLQEGGEAIDRRKVTSAGNVAHNGLHAPKPFLRIHGPVTLNVGLLSLFLYEVVRVTVDTHWRTELGDLRLGWGHRKRLMYEAQLSQAGLINVSKRFYGSR